MTSVRSGLWSVVVGASALFGSGLLGCGSDEPPGSYTLDEFKVALSEQTCVAWTRCGILENIEQCAGLEYPFDMLYRLPELKWAIEAGTVVYDAEAAFACATAVGSPTCTRTAFTAFDTSPEVCSMVSQGLSDEGEECFIEQDCMSGLSCSSTTFPSCELGVCFPTPPPMQIPQAGEECLPPGYSESVPCVPGYGCVDEICVPLPLSDKECVFVLGCENLLERCIRDEAMPEVPRTCKPGLLLGEACTLGDCLGNALCTDGICQQYVAQLGETCSRGNAGLNRCIYPLVCNSFDNVCVNRTPPDVMCLPE